MLVPQYYKGQKDKRKVLKSLLRNMSNVLPIYYILLAIHGNVNTTQN
jgi:hypothetical protein